jgi:anti-sigma regulatory factor (Ser/Thr protein kinase)
MSIEHNATEPAAPDIHESACHGGYRHEALFYGSRSEFLSATLAFIREALTTDEAILVVLDETKIGQLRHELNGDADRVLFADMAQVGSNPARIIQAWQDFLDEHARADNRLWGIGEPIWAGRSAAELAECQRHEELLNVVFSDPEFSLLCPYDTGALGPAVIDRARRSHPFVREAGALRTSTSYPGAAALSAPFDDPLPDPPGTPAVFIFQVGGLRETRHWVGARAEAAGLPAERTADLLLAVNEIATNSLTHGGGGGTVSVWHQDATVVCELRDGGQISDPLVGRRRPAEGAVGGRGLWIANQVCELVQVRTFATGTAIRLHMHLPPADPR